MNTNRANLTDFHPKSSYIFLSIILVVLSTVGLIMLFQILNSRDNSSPSISTSTPTLAPTFIPTVTSKPSLPSQSSTLALTPTLTPTPTATASAEPIKYQSPVDNFEVTYLPARKVYVDAESSGNRYTFYLRGGSFAIHVGNSWSWTYPNRQFDSATLVGGQPSFQYDAGSQTIIDFESNQKKYTIQCIHNGSATLKTECETFLQSFKLL